MKKLKLALMIVLASVTFAAQAGAYSVTIEDTYRGSNKADVVGEISKFDISQMVVDFSGNLLSSVTIYTNYAKNVGALGTRLGDLFISTDGYRTTDMVADTMFTGEMWEYALVLGRNNALYLYEVDYWRQCWGYYDNIKSTDDYFSHSGGTYRNKQETTIDTRYSQYNLGTIGSWSVDSDKGIIAFDLTDTDKVEEYLSASSFGFHWNMTCGNDTIEGGATAPVPEPSSFLLLGAGLLGAGLYRRKNRG